MSDNQSAVPDSHPNELPLVSVIIPVKDGLDLLRLCVDRLLKQDYPADRYEIIVVDNGSAVSPAEALPHDPRVTVLSEPTPGSYSARNTGLDKAVGEIIAFTDADCLPAIDWLSSAVDFLRSDPAVDMIGGRVTLAYRHGEPRNGPEWYEAVEGFPQQRYVQNGFAVTANMVTRRTVFDRVGLFDGTLKSGGDGEWGRRVRDQGGQQRYLATAGVEHPARDSWTELREKTVRTAGGIVRRTMQGAHPRPRLLRLFAGQIFRSAAAVVTVWREPKLPSTTVRLKYLATRLRVNAVICTTLLRGLLARTR